jgi:hypothetical protein
LCLTLQQVAAIADCPPPSADHPAIEWAGGEAPLADVAAAAGLGPSLLGHGVRYAIARRASGAPVAIPILADLRRTKLDSGDPVQFPDLALTLQVLGWYASGEHVLLVPDLDRF